MTSTSRLARCCNLAWQSARLGEEIDRHCDGACERASRRGGPGMAGGGSVCPLLRQRRPSFSAQSQPLADRRFNTSHSYHILTAPPSESCPWGYNCCPSQCERLALLGALQWFANELSSPMLYLSELSLRRKSEHRWYPCPTMRYVKVLTSVGEAR